MKELLFDVALLERDDALINTIVLSGVDVLVPLARDLDHDPLHDDEVRILREDGHFERTLLAGDDDVEPNGEAELLYRFRDVPPGLYRVSVRVAGQWSDVLVGLVVRRAGVFVGGKQLVNGKPHPPAAIEPNGEEFDEDPDHEIALAGDPFVDEA